VCGSSLESDEKEQGGDACVCVFFCVGFACVLCVICFCVGCV